MGYKFPEGFKWGRATSSHQIEGDNHNDWTEWETSLARIEQLKKEGKDPNDFISGKACDSYNRYEGDFDIAKQLNQNIHRFSIEWSRIEPEEGKFDFEAMKHYQRLVKSLRERGIEPMVTLWHFTNPIWFARQGGFLNKKAPEYFTRYAKYVVDNLKDDVKLWITFNEATTVYSGMSYLSGIWPPQKRSPWSALKIRKNVIRAHTLAYRDIKKLYEIEPSVEVRLQQKVSHNVMVGSVEHIKYFISGKLIKYLGIENFINKQLNYYFWSKTFPYQDFLGLNYYRLHRLPGSSKFPKQEMALIMEWEMFPEGVYHNLIYLKKYNKPIYITENGIADSTDQKRTKFIKDHLYWIWKAIQEGVDVRGYLYWSLLDNFEWAHGFSPRFGLVEVDYKTLERRIRPSAFEYAEICKTNTLVYPHTQKTTAIQHF